MLVLARRTNESILIGDDIRVTVLGVEGGVVRLGIIAPGAVRVVRQEILDQIGQANRVAAANDRNELGVVAAWRRKANAQT